MIKHIWTMIWNQRSSNGWIFMELLLVFGVLWIMMDSMLVSLCTYQRPLGFDITNVYKVNIGKRRKAYPDTSQIRCWRHLWGKIWYV